MSRANIEETATTVSSTAPYWTFAGTWTPVSDTQASGGAYASSSTAGATATLTIPAGASPVVDGVLLLCSRLARTGVASVTVDGVALDNWKQDNFTTAAASAGQTWTVATKTVPIAWHRTSYPPIRLTTGVAHTIVITVVSGPVTVDDAECFASVATVVAGRITSIGTSITQGSDLSAALTQRYTALMAAAVGGTDDNHAYAGSALIFDTNATQPGAIGYQQAEGRSTVGTGDVRGVLYSVTVNSGGLYSVAPTGVTFTGGGGSSAAASIQTSGVSPNIQVTGITFTNPGFSYTTAPTVAFTGGTGTAATATANFDTFAGGLHSWGKTPEWFVLAHGVNDYDTFAGLDPGGGVGYILELFKQRTREAIWRVNLNSPNTTVLILGVGYVNDGANNNIGRQNYSVALAGIAAEASMVNTRYADTYASFLNRGGNALFVTSGGTTIHPNAAGHAVIAEGVTAAMFAARARPGGRVLAL